MIRWLVACLLGALASTAPGTALAAGPLPTNPCGGGIQPPQCVAAIGPIEDVSAAWQKYQPALVQVIPISDYAADPEDAPPPLGAGVCGGESSHAAVPGGVVVDSPPAGVPAPPGSHGPYCLLRYLGADFSRPCAGCHRLLLDYARIPAGTSLSPGAEGHWAAKLYPSTFTPAASPFNGHSPNIKNLCSDKFVNPSPGARCDLVAPLDRYALEVEGDSAWFHHYPVEGRYYNGPAYLAGDGSHVPYHWVDGAYVDVRTSAPAAWYSAGYRGRGDTTPDTDQSYGCACELPPFGHQAFSPDFGLASRRGR